MKKPSLIQNNPIILGKLYSKVHHECWRQGKNLSQMELYDSNLNGADLGRVNLSKAKFDNANFCRASLNQCKFK